MRITPSSAGPSASDVAAGRHLERAQAVWLHAVELADGASGGSGVAFDLLRAAEFDPSTLRHALTLGSSLLRRRPEDVRLRSGRELLAAATDWLGAPATDGEVGSAAADRRRRSGAGATVAPPRPGGPM